MQQQKIQNKQHLPKGIKASIWIKQEWWCRFSTCLVIATYPLGAHNTHSLILRIVSPKLVCISGKRASYVYGDHNQIILTSHLSRSDHITLKILKFKLYSIISIWKTIIFVIVYDNKYNKFVNIHRAKQAVFWVGSSGGIKN